MERKIMEIDAMRRKNDIWRYMSNEDLITEIHMAHQFRFDGYNYGEFNILVIKTIIELLKSRGVYVSKNVFTDRFFINPLKKIFKWNTEYFE